MLKAVIMDFDGVIIDTEGIWYQIFVDWFKENVNYDLSIDEFLVSVGSDSEDLFTALERNHHIQIDREKFVNDTKRIFIEKSDSLPPLEGVVHFIQSVKEEGLQLALATSSTKRKPMKHLKRLQLIDYFDSIVTAEDVERIKPFPDLFLKAIERLGVEKDEALVVEDSLNGLMAANRSAIKTLLVPNDVTKHSDFNHYYKKVETLSEVHIPELMSDFNA